MPTLPAKRMANTPAVTAGKPAPSGQTLRMRDLVRLTGLPRETIHFYLAQGLLPKPLKTGRNTAVYGEEHLDRLHRIKDLQDRHFLPLRAIKAVLEEGSGGEFSQQQDALLQRVRASLPAGHAHATAGDVALASLVPSRVTRSEFEKMKHLGIIEVRGRGETASVSVEDALILECWSEARSLTRAGERPLTADLLAIYDDAMTSLIARETRVLTQIYSALPGERLAEIIDRGAPVVLRLLGALRRKKIAALLAGGPAAGPVAKG